MDIITCPWCNIFRGQQIRIAIMDRWNGWCRISTDQSNAKERHWCTQWKYCLLRKPNHFNSIRFSFSYLECWISPAEIRACDKHQVMHPFYFVIIIIISKYQKMQVENWKNIYVIIMENYGSEKSCHLGCSIFTDFIALWKILIPSYPNVVINTFEL